MKNLKRKLLLASIVCCGSIALGFGSLNNASVAVSANTLDGFEVKEASLRIPDETYGKGIRFTVGLGNVTLAEGATSGVLLIPASTLGADELTVGYDSKDLVDSPITWKTTENGKEAYVHLYGVPETQYTTDISMRAYIDDDANPDTAPIYSNVVTTSVADVADWAYNNDANLDDAEKATLQSTYLTYDVVYRDADGDELYKTTGVYNQKLADVYTLAENGKSIEGWYNKAGTQKWDYATTKVSSTTTNLYAKWIDDYSVEGTNEWNIGDMTFKGVATMRGVDTMPKMQKGLYPMDGGVKITLGAHSYAGFEASLKTPIDATSEDKFVYITAKGADANLFTVVEFNESGSALTGAKKGLTIDEGNGYTTYVFRIAKGSTVGKFRITPLGNTTATGSGSEIIITNVTVGDYDSLHTGEDANTIFFYDSPLGVDMSQMYYKSGNNHTSVTFTTEKAYGDERGSTKFEGVKYGSNAYALYAPSNSQMSSADQEFLQDGDYLVFNVYSTAPNKLFFSVKSDYTTTGHKLMPNAWTKIVIPASSMTKSANYYFLINHIVSDSTLSGTEYDLYFSKIVRCSADEVTDLSSVASTDTWTVGSTTFIGTPSVANYTGGGGVLAATEYKKARLVNDELVITFTRASDPYIKLNLAEAIEVEAGKDMYVTVTMYDYGRLDKMNGYFNASGSYVFSYVTHVDIGGGYAKVTFKCSAKSSAYTITSVRLDVEDLLNSNPTLASQLVIRDIVVSANAN
ncbi:MAG: hypothetical protein E7343_04860 [Clostridiales bacterium]|nr:hypothetical protein [Clostridiales bacterium]